MSDPYDFLRRYFTRNDVIGLLAIWRHLPRDEAASVLDGFDRLLAERPPDLIERFHAATEYVLNHVSPTKITPYSYDDYLSWLAALRDKMRAIFDETGRPPSEVSRERRADPVAFFRQICKSFFADNSPADTLRLWRIALANGGPYPDDVLWCLDTIAAHPPPELGRILYEDGWITLENETPEAWLRARTAELRGAQAKR